MTEIVGPTGSLQPDLFGGQEDGFAREVERAIADLRAGRNVKAFEVFTKASASPGIYQSICDWVRAQFQVSIDELLEWEKAYQALCLSRAHGTA